MEQRKVPYRSLGKIDPRQKPAWALIILTLPIPIMKFISITGFVHLGFLSMLPSRPTYNDPLLVMKGAFHVEFTGNKSRAGPGWRPPSE
jgi:hypothetical protein